MIRRALTVLATTVVFTLAGCGSGAEPKASAASALPADFFGVVAPELLPAQQGELRQALDAQSKAGVRLIRQPFRWNEIEAEAGRYDYGFYDRLVGEAAKSGISIMPIVFGVPKREAAKKVKGAKVTKTTTMPPKRPAAYAKFAATLVKRYGPAGQYWAANPSIPKVPVTAWQVWNEPNLPPYWGGKPDAKAYGKLLKTASKAIRKADPKARILTGGVPESKLGIPMLSFIKTMTASAGAGSFDVVAAHPYAKSASGVLQGAAQARKAASRGSFKPKVWITECGWATGRLKSDFTVSETKQAKLVDDLVRQSAAKADSIGLVGVVYYAWRDVPPYPGGKDFWGLHTGLVNKNNSVKPSLTAWANAIADVTAQ